MGHGSRRRQLSSLQLKDVMSFPAKQEGNSVHECAPDMPRILSMHGFAKTCRDFGVEAEFVLNNYSSAAAGLLLHEPNVLK